MEFATTLKWFPDGERIIFEESIEEGRQVYEINVYGWQVDRVPLHRDWVALIP